MNGGGDENGQEWLWMGDYMGERRGGVKAAKRPRNGSGGRGSMDGKRKEINAAALGRVTIVWDSSARNRPRSRPLPRISTFRC